MSEFKWHQFEGEIILWAVRWYVSVLCWPCVHGLVLPR